MKSPDAMMAEILAVAGAAWKRSAPKKARRLASSKQDAPKTATKMRQKRPGGVPKTATKIDSLEERLFRKGRAAARRDYSLGRLRLPREVFDACWGDPTALRVFAAVLNFCASGRGECWASQRTIAAASFLRKRETVRKALGTLLRKGLLYQRSPSGYVVSPRLWKPRRDFIYLSRQWLHDEELKRPSDFCLLLAYLEHPDWRLSLKALQDLTGLSRRTLQRSRDRLLDNMLLSPLAQRDAIPSEGRTRQFEPVILDDLTDCVTQPKVPR